MPTSPATPDLSDRDAFAAAYRRLAPSALATATGVLRDRDAAEDVVQEVFAALWSRPDAFRPERGPLGSYVQLLVRSRSLDRLRRQATAQKALDRAAGEARVRDPDLESAHDAVVRRDTVHTLLKVLDAQPPPQRAAVLLHHVGGLSDRELATAMRIPLGTAKSRIRLGVRRAAEQLAAA